MLTILGPYVIRRGVDIPRTLFGRKASALETRRRGTWLYQSSQIGCSQSGSGRKMRLSLPRNQARTTLQRRKSQQKTTFQPEPIVIMPSIEKHSANCFVRSVVRSAPRKRCRRQGIEEHVGGRCSHGASPWDK